MYETEEKKRKFSVSWIVGIVLIAMILMTIIAFGIPAFARYQARQNAENEIHLNSLKMHQTEQLVTVETQKAQVRIEEAKGIAAAQQLINATLTDQYLQHEAIGAQVKMAGSPAHTQIYIPVGQNGIPIVKTVKE